MLQKVATVTTSKEHLRTGNGNWYREKSRSRSFLVLMIGFGPVSFGPGNGPGKIIVNVIFMPVPLFR